jgi:hypothetical protein
MKMSVALRVYGPQVDPGAVTAALGVQPKEQHRAGDQRRGNQGRTYDPFTSGLWLIESDLPGTVSLSEHVLNLLNRVNSTKLRTIAGMDVYVDLFVGVFLHDEPSSVLLTPAAAETIASLGIPLDIAMYP